MRRLEVNQGTLTKRAGIGRRESLYGYALIMPMLIGYAIFVIAPLVILLILSLTNYSLFGKVSFVGLQNYLKLFTQDATFTASAVNTVYSRRCWYRSMWWLRWRWRC